MLIAREKRRTNIIEFILYMYQIEDIIRSFQFNSDIINQTIVEKHDQSAEVKEEMKEWYLELINKMTRQEIKKAGHLDELRTLIDQLQNLHDRLLTTYFDKRYIDLYDSAKPHLKELTIKSVGQKLSNQIDVAIHGVYGYLVLRLKQQEIGEETKKAMEEITALLAHLARQFNRMEEGDLSLSYEQEN